MNKLKILSILIALLVSIYLIAKIEIKKDLIWNLKNIFHHKIIFQLKKIYIIYSHDFRNKINLEKNINQKIKK